MEKLKNGINFLTTSSQISDHVYWVDLLLKAAFERIFNVMQFILVKIK
jgi:hypothetical protein